MDVCGSGIVDAMEAVALGKKKPLSEVPPYYASPNVYSYSKKGEDSNWKYCKNEWEPSNIDLANYYARYRTFAKWPKQMVPGAQELAQAGFYYTVQGDITVCFFCGCAVYNWELVDNAFEEHRRWSPCCKYLNMIC